MERTLIDRPAERGHTRRQALVFAVKAWGLRWQRMAREAAEGKPRRLQHKPVDEARPVAVESRSPLYPSRVPAEFALQAGKVQNLRLVAARLDGLNLPAGEVFSFWRQVGRPTARRGFVPGRELREGCIIPSIGGGLCQLSNALYDAALGAGCEIVERHAHSRIIPGSMAEAGRDATIFWNYVDLRFRPTVDCQLEVKLTDEELVVRLRAENLVPRKIGRIGAEARGGAASNLGSCETCGVMSLLFDISNPGAAPVRASPPGWWMRGGRNTTITCKRSENRATGCSRRSKASG
ncbi:MAG: VanW family protein [Chthoniobacteraceae bacterium]